MAKAKTTKNSKVSMTKKTVKSAKKKTLKQAPNNSNSTAKSKNISTHIIRFCSFCGRSSDTRKRLFAGPDNVFICDECVEICVAILFEDINDEWTLRLNNIFARKMRFNIQNIEDDNPTSKRPHSRKFKKLWLAPSI